VTRLITFTEQEWIAFRAEVAGEVAKYVMGLKTVPQDRKKVMVAIAQRFEEAAERESAVNDG